VDAIVALAGAAVVFGPVGLAELSTPVMAIGGTRDADSRALTALAPGSVELPGLTYRAAGY
jgi:hypothetical protein